jgi:hypothetical protein
MSCLRSDVDGYKVPFPVVALPLVSALFTRLLSLLHTFRDLRGPLPLITIAPPVGSVKGPLPTTQNGT